MNARIDLTGKVFNRLTVLRQHSSTLGGKVKWECLCECGKIIVVQGGNLLSGHTKSCGCFKKDSQTTHGLKEHLLYQTWANMKDRILNENYHCYEDYGGRGIKICDRWMYIENFIIDMYPTFRPGLSLNRVDPNGNYCPENCKWATWSEQAHFKRKRSGCSSQYYGVFFYKRDKKFLAKITYMGNREKLGSFVEEIDAAIAYDNRSEEVYGDRPNNTVRSLS